MDLLKSLPKCSVCVSHRQLLISSCQEHQAEDKTKVFFLVPHGYFLEIQIMLFLFVLDLEIPEILLACLIPFVH